MVETVGIKEVAAFFGGKIVGADPAPISPEQWDQAKQRLAKARAPFDFLRSMEQVKMEFLEGIDAEKNRVR